MGGKKQYHDEETGSLTMLVTDLLFEDFRNAWVKLVNGDRFGDVCVTAEDPDTNGPIVLPEGDNVVRIENAYGDITVTNCDNDGETKNPGRRRRNRNDKALAQDVSEIFSHSNWGTHIFAIIGLCAVLKSFYSACAQKSGDTLYQDISQEA